MVPVIDCLDAVWGRGPSCGFHEPRRSVDFTKLDITWKESRVAAAIAADFARIGDVVSAESTHVGAADGVYAAAGKFAVFLV